MVFDQDWPDYLQRALFLYLRDFRAPTQRSYSGRIRSREIPLWQSKLNSAIGMGCENPEDNFGVSRSENREITQRLLDDNQMRKDGNFSLLRALCVGGGWGDS